MKTQKLSLKGIKNVLGRSEMKKIMAGSGGCSSYNNPCNVTGMNLCCSGAVCLPDPDNPLFFGHCSG